MADQTITEIIGEKTRFFVASSDKTKEPYLVDLSEFEGTGSCGCPNFQFRLLPKLEQGERDWETSSLRCRHILKARDYFLDALLRGMP